MCWRFAMVNSGGLLAGGRKCRSPGISTTFMPAIDCKFLVIWQRPRRQRILASSILPCMLGPIGN